jgi:hypothetical protein
MTKHEAIPSWIHGLEEYEQMFDLKPDDYTKSILDFPGSISSFNADVSLKAQRVVSGDAIYGMSFEEVENYAHRLMKLNCEHLTEHADQVLKLGKSALEPIFAMWKDNYSRFLDDYVAGKMQSRYQQVLMPELPYETHEFQLALCSDYVFNRHAQNDCKPEQVVSELCRVAEEVRIFPLLTEEGDISEWLGPLMLDLQNRNHGIEIRQVSFENVKGGNAMLRAWALECVVEQ